MSDLRTTEQQRRYIGWMIRTLRSHPDRGWNQGELADRVNGAMGRTYWNADRISTLERGVTRLPAEWVPAFAVVLGVTSDTFLGIGTYAATGGYPDYPNDEGTNNRNDDALVAA